MADKRKKPVKNPRQVSTRVGLVTRVMAHESAGRVQRMSDVERAAKLAALEKDLAQYAPTMEAVSGDLLALLQLVGMEFARRYYPDCDYATFTLSKYPADPKSAHRIYEYMASIPLPLPVAEREVRRG